jgi:hypothetical protein
MRGSWPCVLQLTDVPAGGALAGAGTPALGASLHAEPAWYREHPRQISHFPPGTAFPSGVALEVARRSPCLAHATAAAAHRGIISFTKRRRGAITIRHRR